MSTPEIIDISSKKLEKHNKITQKMVELNIPNPYNPVNIAITDKDLVDIFKKYGLKKVRIHDINNYQLAFIHKSYIHSKVKNFFKKNNLNLSDIHKSDTVMKLQPKSNERLEFLGDSIISSVLVSYLYRRFPDADEGFMTKLKSRIVCSDSLGRFARKCELNKFLVISSFVEDENGRDNTRILEDLFESFVGAMYIDICCFKPMKGLRYGPGYAFIETWLINLFEKEVDFEKLILNDENFKDILIKTYQNKFGKSPEYIELEVSGGKQNREYTIGVVDKFGNVIGIGKDKTKKKAEQLASKKALEYFKNNT